MSTATSDTGFLSQKWIKKLARTGYASRSLVYFIIGLFAVLSGLGHSGETDSKGALRLLLEQPFGKALVGVLIVGMSGYVMWRLIQSLLDTDSHGWSPKGLVVRGGLLASAITYAVLTVYALSLLGVLPYSGSDSSPSIADRIASTIGTKPVLLVMMMVFAGVTIAHWFKAFTGGYAKHFNQAEARMDIVHPVAKLGLLARGTVFAIITLLLFYRLMTVTPTDTKPPGLSEALNFVQQLPAGNMLLIVLGIGLLLFSAYCASEAMWRQINVEDAEFEEQLD
ncbi:DUF1206 domain-containing protein [Granulosicoccus antarcticus]|uniref:DUF1206 domain-containing protein n=1 Tax=Granulosicoccus antarcticus IMCC3135 TaxID=1192854 RepID=A0A2Z2NHR8_9GAMM|nr:DUF1206 domain-containing protein [Granulosicoccus antarcticus]ASJ70689.1 hypothetical protein IMCC3135_02880 [Granulosicoccus antarcticus IMCC3135]